MADSPESNTLKELSEKIDKQALAFHQMMQQFMTAVDARLDELRSTIPDTPTNVPSSSKQPLPVPPLSSSPSDGRDLSPMVKSMKMEVPRFDGSDPHGWVFRVEEFFKFHGTPEHQRLRIVSFHMEGRAAGWYQWMKSNNLLTTWREFLANLKYRFATTLYDDPQGELSKLTQTTTVAEFQSAFEELMNRVNGVSEQLLISFFITGLQQDIRRELLSTTQNTSTTQNYRPQNTPPP
ncbi:hypothetical protein AB3S75_041121 [Citrus x aurantiifolia]